MKSWLKYTLRTAAILLTATLLTTSCLQSDFDEPLLAGDTVKVSFNPTLDNNETTRVGEGTSVDILYAELYLDGKLIGERHVYEVSSGNISGFSMELLKNQTYTIVFWAQNESCGAYNTSDLSKIQITYPNSIDFSDIKNIEKYDAFYAKCNVTVNAKTISDGVDIQLTRPFALVVAGTNEQVEDDTTSSLTFSSIATQFDAFTGKASVDTEGATTTISFKPKNSTIVPDKEQVMLGIAYVLPIPNLAQTTVTVTTTLDSQSKETGIDIPNLTANKRYNLLGSNLVVDAGWGGTTYLSLPAVATDGWIHITEAEQLATLLRDGYDNSGNTINGIHLCASFNMGKKEITPTETATFKNVIIDGAAYSVNSTYNLDTPIDENRITEGGGIYELKGLNISGKGVFNSTDTFTARYIKFTNVTVNSAAEAGGVVGTATGSLTLTNITVSGTVTGANKVGGLVGYIDSATGTTATLTDCSSSATVNATAEAGGVVGTATGSLTLTDITVSGTVTGANKVGGLVGYIDSATGTTATLTDCSSSATVNATAKAGALVGWFNGYDESETLNFIDCSTTSESTFTTPFCGAEQACFNTNDLALSTYEQHLLGGEEYCRGTINYGYVDGDENLTSKRFFYRWDGVRSVKPIFDGEETDKKVFIYSPYDLAYCQGNSYTSMTFHNDVDMGGKDEELEWDGNTIRTTVGVDFARRFTPIQSVKNLTGNNCTIHNLRVQMTHDGSGAGLIQNISGGTVKDLTINKAYIFNDNDWSLGIPSYPTKTGFNDNGEGNAYAGVLSANLSGTSTVSNIAVSKSKVFAICKMGGLFGRISGSNCNINYCTVDSCTIQNYQANVPNYYEIPPTEVSAAGINCIVNGLQWWYTQGEVGGLVGFIKAINTKISNCSVINTTLNCYGQDDKTTYANVWIKKKSFLTMLYTEYSSSSPFKKNQNVPGVGSTVIAGRHINQFIGDIVAVNSSYVTTITDYHVENNTYVHDSDSHQYSESNSCPIVGSAYYVGVDVNIASKQMHVQDYAGKLIIQKNGNTELELVETSPNGNNRDWMGGSFQIDGFLVGASTTFPNAPTEQEIIPVGGYSKTDPRSGN